MVPDELLMDRFRVLERIGSGGMGTVHRAFDERLQRQVAVKEVEAADPQRVVREAQAAARLNHPAIVTLYELGERDGRALLVTELVPGQTLAEAQRCGELCDRDVGEITAGLCDALAHAHQRGVVHRDIKPQNVIVRDRDGGRGRRRAKLMDFGIARIAGAPTLTARGEVVGTLAYMSPEQAEGRLAGPESDVYSLALTAYECWGGLNPVAGETPAATARRIGAEVEPLELHRPDLPAQLTETIDACLDPDPELRPTALELRDGIESELAHLDASRSVPATEASEPQERRARIGTGRIAVLGLLVAGLALLAGPLGVGGLALVLTVLCLPAAIAGAPAAALSQPLVPLLSAVGIPAAAAVLGSAGPSPLARASLGAGSWAWLITGSLAFGIGPDLGIGEPAEAGWTTDPGLAASAILAPLGGLESLLGMGIFALGAVALGWALSARHASIALLGAMLWAAAIDAGLASVGDGSLGDNQLGVVAGAAIAVAIEFRLRLLDVAARPAAEAATAAGPRPLTT